MWEVDLGQLPLRWDEDGDAFDRQLMMLIRLGGSSSFGSDDGDLTHHVEYEACDSAIGSWMLAERDEGWIHCVVYSHDDADEPREEQVAPWREAVEGAVWRMAAGAVATWNALLGPLPQLRVASTAGADGQPVALAAETAVGPLRLIPGGVQLHEMVSAEPYPLRDDRVPCSSWPMLVEGTVACHGEMPDAPVVLWGMDDQAAARHAQRAAATLAWDEIWTVRQPPVRIAAGARIPVPHLAGHHGTGSNWADGCPGGWDRPAPSWTRTPLAGALDAYYQAVRMDLEHPSFAAVGYVTVVEGIGGRGVRRPRAKASYRNALTAVMAGPEADELAGIAYRIRNATAHSGVVHGGERTLGYLLDSQFRISAEELLRGRRTRPPRPGRPPRKPRAPAHAARSTTPTPDRRLRTDDRRMCRPGRSGTPSATGQSSDATTCARPRRRRRHA